MQSHQQPKNRIIYRGQVYRCNLELVLEVKNVKNVLVLFSSTTPLIRTSPNTVVAPITHTNLCTSNCCSYCREKDSSGKLILDGNVLLGNITCEAKQGLRLHYDLTADEMRAVDKAIFISLDTNHYYQTLQKYV